MKTASFFTYTGPGRVSISRSAPRGVMVPAFRLLAPGAWFKEPNEARYRELYFAQLAQLDPQEVWDDLHRTAVGGEPVLLCWEKLNKPGEFCHRRMVAEWFEQSLGHVVEEIRAQPARRAPQLF